jgi:predicted RNA binding protein YcfA (HicA-like mRNA interferase family)
MPSFPPISSALLIKKLKKFGFSVDESKGKGSHAKLYGHDGKTTTIPKSLDSPSTRSSIAKFLIDQGVNLDEMFK